MTPTHRSDDMTDKLLREALADLLSWFDSGPSEHGHWIIRAGEQGADDAVEAARAALAAAPQPAPDREAVLYRFLEEGEVIEKGDECPDDNCASWEPVNGWAVGMGYSKMFKTIRRPVGSDALLARGLRLPSGEETMAWEVLGEDREEGEPHLIYYVEDTARGIAKVTGERVVRVAIRVVEGGDDA